MSSASSSDMSAHVLTACRAASAMASARSRAAWWVASAMRNRWFLLMVLFSLSLGLDGSFDCFHPVDGFNPYQFSLVFETDV